jgi:hypothetical protein
VNRLRFSHCAEFVCVEARRRPGLVCAESCSARVSLPTPEAPPCVKDLPAAGWILCCSFRVLCSFFSSVRVPSPAVGGPVFACRCAAPHQVSALPASICVSLEQVVPSPPRHTVGCAISSASSFQSSLIRGSITEAGPVFVLGCSRLDLLFPSTRAERCKRFNRCQR